MAFPTPIVDFVREYNRQHTVRAHMPGHKGTVRLGPEQLDITEIFGADALYEASGIIAESEEYARRLFGSGATVYSAEGSSQSVRAMLLLAMTSLGGNGSRKILAGRNAHKSFIYACALLGIDPVWLMPEGASPSVCACPVSARGVEDALRELSRPPIGVYITAPDYLGGSMEIESVAGVCHGYGVPLLVDNAHGAYLRFLSPSRHPLDLGADLVCDSAHKTLPVLTGGGYLHVSGSFLPRLTKAPKEAMALFGSTSPSYLILQSLDICNAILSGDYPVKIRETCARVDSLKEILRSRGFTIPESDPLRITILDGRGGKPLASHLRGTGIECEYAGPEGIVLMLTPDNPPSDFDKIDRALAHCAPYPPSPLPELSLPEKVITPREALLRPSLRVPLKDAIGKICADPSVSCPPAVPVVVSGERISAQTIEIMAGFGFEEISVVR